MSVPPDVKVVVEPEVIHSCHHIFDEVLHRTVDLGCIPCFHCLVLQVPFKIFSIDLMDSLMKTLVRNKPCIHESHPFVVHQWRSLQYVFRSRGQKIPEVLSGRVKCKYYI